VFRVSSVSWGLVHVHATVGPIGYGRESKTVDETLTTMRLFVPVVLAPYPAILAYLQRIGSREGYRREMEKGDPGFSPMLT